MNISTMVLLTFFLVYSVGIAQETTPQKKNSLEDGAWALQFQINNNFTLTSFGGATISVKHFTSSTSALRLGATLNGSLSNDDNINPTQVDSIYRKSHNDANSQSIVMQVQFLFYPSPTSDINFFWGLGPFASYARTKETREFIQVVGSQDSTLNKSSNTSYSWGVGASGAVGVEWFANRSISLSAEYFASIGYSVSNSKSENEIPPLPTPESTRKAFNITSSGVRFGLSAYF